jgi:autotransporter-associated beta strand protein
MISLKRSASRRHSFILSGAIATLLAAGPVHAANKTWDGGGTDDNWLTGPNWDADLAPAINDALFFAGSLRLGPLNNFAAGTLFNGITFSAGAGAFTLSGNGITLTPGINLGTPTVVGGNITNSSVNAQTLSIPLTLSSGNHTIVTAASSGALNLNGTFSRSTGGTAVFTRTVGNINFSNSGLENDGSLGGGLLGGWAILGGEWAALDASKNVIAYNGYTLVQPGTAIVSGGTQNIKIPTNGANVSLAAAGTTDINTLIFSGGAAAQTLDVGVGNVLRLGTQGGIYNASQVNGTARGFTIAAGGTVTAGGADNTPGEITFSDSLFTSTINNLTVNSAITDNGTGQVRVNVLGYVVFGNVVNTYSGGTFINQGRVQAGNSAAFGSGPVTVYPGAEAFLNAGGIWANNFNISGFGPTETTGGVTGPGAIRLGNTANITGTVTLQGSTRISVGSTANVPQISGQITGTGPLEIIAFATTPGSNLMLANANLAAPNNWTGDLAIRSLNVDRDLAVRLGADEQIPDTASVTMSTADTVSLNLNGFDEKIGGLSSAVNANIQITNTGIEPSILTLGSNGASGNFGGAMTEAGGTSTLGIVKIGNGTQVLAGSNTYSGTTNIDGGTLSVTGSLLTTGLVNVNSSATGAGMLSGAGDGLVNGLVGNVTLAANNGANVGHIAPGATSEIGSIGTLTLAGLTILGGDLAFDLSATNDLINVTGTAAFAAASTITPSSNAPNGTYTVLTAGTLTLTVPPTIISPTDTRKTFISDFGTPNTIKIVVGGSSKTLNWTGANGSAWDVNTTFNWNDGTIAEKYFNGDTVNFIDGPTNRTLTLSGITVTPAAVNVNNSAGDYAITGTGAIGGATSLAKSGSSKLTLVTNNSFTGGTTNALNSILQIGDGGATGTVGSGTVANDGTLIFNRSDVFTFANTISGSGEVRQSGNGTLVLSGTNTYTGPTAINSGTVRVTNNASLGELPGGPVNIAAGAALDLAGNIAGNNANFGQKQFNVAGDGVGGTGALVNTGPANQQNAFQRVALTADASFGGTTRFDIRAAQVGGLNVAALDLAGHTLTKNGPFFLALVATDVSDGDIVVNGGTLNIESTTSIPDFGTNKSITFNAGTNLQFFNNSPNPSTVMRPIAFNGSGIQIGNSSTQASLIGSPMLLKGDVTLTALIIAAPGTLTLTGNITESGGAHSITKTGNCTVTLSGNNTFSGGTTVNAGTLMMGSATALGAATGNLTVNTGGTLDLNGNNLTVGALSGTGGTITNTSFGALTFSAGNAADTVFAGVIQNNIDPIGFTKQGTGKLVLTGANIYTGPTTVTAGALVVGDGVSGSLSGTSSVNIANGATLGGSGSIIGSISNVTLVTLAAGASLAPGNSAGTLNFDLGPGLLDVVGAAGVSNGFKFELGTTSDKVALLTGGLSIGTGVLDLNDFVFTDAGGFGEGTYTLFDGTAAINGTLGSNLIGSVLGLSATLGFADNGNDIVLVVVPEPGTAIALFAGLSVLALRRKRTCGLI